METSWDLDISHSYTGPHFLTHLLIQGVLDIRVAFVPHLTTDNLSDENKVIFNRDITFNWSFN